ncbi:hypothetical protein, partial [uncultured Gammaproteobacteria bacterium]
NGFEIRKIKLLSEIVGVLYLQKDSKNYTFNLAK